MGAEPPAHLGLGDVAGHALGAGAHTASSRARGLRTAGSPRWRGRGPARRPPTGVHHQHPVAHQRDLSQLAGVQQDGGTLVGELAQQSVDLRLGLDVDAPGGVEAQQHLEAGGQPAADRQLLLVATGQPAHLALGAHVDVEPVDGTGHPGSSRRRPARTTCRSGCKAGRRGSRSPAVGEAAPGAGPPGPAPCRAGWRRTGTGPTTARLRPGSHPSRPGDLRTGPGRAGPGPGPRGRRCRGSRRRRSVRETSLTLPPRERWRVSSAAGCSAPGARRPASSAVASSATSPSIAATSLRLAALARRQRLRRCARCGGWWPGRTCCRTSVSRWVMNRTERPSDFQCRMTVNTCSAWSADRAAVISSRSSRWGSCASALARSSSRRTREREVLDGGVEVERPEVHPVQPLQHGIGVDPGEPQVLVDGEVGDQRRVLEHGGQPGTGGVARPSQVRIDPVDRDRPAVGGDHPREDLDHGALPGPVGPEQGVDLARHHGEVHRSQGDDRAIALGDGPGLEQGGRVGHGWLSAGGRHRTAAPMVGDRAPTAMGARSRSRFRSAAHRCAGDDVVGGVRRVRRSISM